MINGGSYNVGERNARRYSARNNIRPTNFLLVAPQARQVSLVGDFNHWNPSAHPLKRHVDGSWQIQAPLPHGHHRYLFLVDGVPTLDPRAHGTERDERHQKVSIVAVS